MTTCLGKSCSFGLLCVVFRGRLENFVCVFLSVLVLMVDVCCDCINSWSLPFCLL